MLISLITVLQKNTSKF